MQTSTGNARTAFIAHDPPLTECKNPKNWLMFIPKMIPRERHSALLFIGYPSVSDLTLSPHPRGWGPNPLRPFQPVLDASSLNGPQAPGCKSLLAARRALFRPAKVWETQPTLRGANGLRCHSNPFRRRRTYTFRRHGRSSASLRGLARNHTSGNALGNQFVQPA